MMGGGLAKLRADAVRVATSYRFRAARNAVRPRTVALHVRRRLRGERLVVVLGSGHRVGSTWVTQMLEDLVCFEYEFEYRRVPKVCRGYSHTINLERPETYAYLRGLRGFRFFKTHSHLTWPDVPDHVRFISVFRDPRDVIVSTVFHLTNLGAHQGGFGAEQQALSHRDKILRVLDNEYALERMEHWFRHEHVHQIRYENVKRQPAAELRRIVGFLGVDVAEDAIEQVVERHRFKRRSGRRPGQEDNTAFLRKGIVGDWQNYFDEVCCDTFKHAKNGRWNRLLLEMGYVSSLDWPDAVQVA